MDWSVETGPLKNILADPTVSEIMINGPKMIFVEKQGKIFKSSVQFADQEALMKMLHALAVAMGREINRREPFLDLRLPDGSRLNAVFPPVALRGPQVTIRVFSAKKIAFTDLIHFGTLNDKVVYFFSKIVQLRNNIIVSGGTGSGKTTLLNVMASFINPSERLVCMEDVSELRLNNANLVQLETRPSRGEIKETNMEDLVRNALRMRPDRIIVGEVRGGEAWDMLLAMNTGHNGSMATVHANSAYDALRRLEGMVKRAGYDVPHDVLREDISQTINFVVQAQRFSDGKRLVTEVSEVMPVQEDKFVARRIFKLDQNRILRSTGVVPEIFKRIKAPDFPQDFFDPNFEVTIDRGDKAS